MLQPLPAWQAMGARWPRASSRQFGLVPETAPIALRCHRVMHDQRHKSLVDRLWMTCARIDHGGYLTKGGPGEAHIVESFELGGWRENTNGVEHSCNVDLALLDRKSLVFGG